MITITKQDVEDFELLNSIKVGETVPTRQRTGTETVMANCRGCKKDGGDIHQYHAWQRENAYGHPTGLWCDQCYNGDTYPYRKDDDYFDPAYAGESLEEEEQWVT